MTASSTTVYALRDDGKAIAYITTDGATSATLHLADVGGNNVKVGGAPVDALAVAWLSPTRVLVVRGREGTSTAQAFTAAGPDKAKPHGPLLQVRLRHRRRQARPGHLHAQREARRRARLVAYSVDTLKPLKKKTWREDSEGQIKKAPRR